MKRQQGLTVSKDDAQTSSTAEKESEEAGKDDRERECSQPRAMPEKEEAPGPDSGQREMECVWVMILFLHWSLSGAQYFDLEGEGSVVVAPGSDVTLPCSLTPHMSAVDMEVKWTRQDLGDTLVHHYKNKQDQTGDQDHSYKNRTSLFIEELNQGNTSLLLKNVQVSDGGQYRCQVDSAHWRDHISVQLRIEATGGTPEITVLGTGVSESCGDLKGFYARLRLTAHESKTNIYICRVKQGQIRMEKQIDITDHLSSPGKTAAITVPILLILLLALGGVICFMRRAQRREKERLMRDIETAQMREKERLMSDNETADMCLKREGERCLHGVKFTDAQWEYVEHKLLTSEDLDEFDLRKYDPSEECFLKLQKVVYACRKAQLSYCGLTEKSCDVLASVLTSKSSLRELDLSGNILHNSGVKKLCSGLKSKDCKLEKLSLSLCNIREEGCAALCSALKKNPSHLRELNLNSNNPYDLGVKQLSALLEDTHCALEKLDLSNCSIGEEGCVALCSALKTNPSSHLKELNLNYNKPGDSGVKQLSALLEDTHCTLEKLVLSHCSIRKEGCAALCSALMKNPSSHLRELNLNSNEPGDSGVKQLSALLEDPQCTLEKLVLSNCSIREEGCAALCSALRSNPSSHLRELNLNSNEPGDSGVKQLSVLLEDPHCTLETLEMSYCRITEEGCAALCSALRSNPSSHLRDLNLDYNKPGVSGVKQLSALLEETHCTLEILHLSDCSITEESCVALCSALKKNPSSHLRELKLSYNEPGDLGVKQLSDLLEDPHCTLEKLHLCNCSITEEGCAALCSALKKNPSHLRELNLDYNKPGVSGMKQLSDLLEDPHCKLEKLLLSSSRITEEGCVALCSALKKNPSHMRELNLNNNKLGDSGVKQLSALLEDPHCKLEKLHLSYCSITEEGCADLCSALKKNPSDLRELNLNHNKPGDSGVKQLSALLEDLHCKLEKLHLSKCSIREEGCVALCSALKKNPSSHLRELKLNYNEPGDSGVKQLSDLLDDPHCTLEKLHLCNCSITEEGCAALCSALKKNPSHLRELNLNHNEPGDSGVKQLSALLEDPHCKLEKLHLSSCSIREEGCAALCSALKKNPSSHLRELNLDSNKPGYTGQKQLSALLEDPHCKLEKLHL
ncbi:uncharacterized protein LOC143486731 isoform X2 [Brachyhypopomus gauderio]|uniref:uncharacterized protein LOC143486731 isoform X2 n=1 Tax=Brachyhypopomus gauderio TaxID=698409 RepID=UPI004040EEDE